VLRISSPRAHAGRPGLERILVVADACTDDTAELARAVAAEVVETDCKDKAGCEEYCERELDEVEWRAGRVCLPLGARPDDPPRD
jgi:hypothetical protein